MKKIIAWSLAVLLVLPMGAFAEGKVTTANGVVKAVTTYDLVAPFSGTLLPFSWEKGDAVKDGETLFVLDTIKVYAHEAGKVTLFAKVGDDASDVLSQYGMLASVEKNAPLIINATTRNANNTLENKFVHNGETLYFKLTQDTDEVGYGRVTYVSGKEYTVEIAEGDFKLGQRVKLYREEKRTTKSCVGDGTIARAEEVPVLGTGRIINCAVQDGQMVQKGDLLYETVASDCAVDMRSVNVTSPKEGVLDVLKVVSGQQVYKGQVLATVHDTSALKVVGEVDEVDLARVQTGMAIALVFDSYPEQQVSGTVQKISLMGTQKQNATYYDVDIAFTTELDVRLFMNATVSIP